MATEKDLHHTQERGYRDPLRDPLGSAHVSERFAERHPDHVERISKHQLLSIVGRILGLACILGGIALFLNGVAGSTNWSAKLFGAESTISDAAPGAVLFGY